MSVDHAYGRLNFRRARNIRSRQYLRQHQHTKMMVKMPQSMRHRFMTVGAKSEDDYASTRTMKYSFRQRARAWQAPRKIRTRQILRGRKDRQDHLHRWHRKRTKSTRTTIRRRRTLRVRPSLRQGDHQADMEETLPWTWRVASTGRSG